MSNYFCYSSSCSSRLWCASGGFKLREISIASSLCVTARQETETAEITHALLGHTHWRRFPLAHRTLHTNTQLFYLCGHLLVCFCVCAGNAQSYVPPSTTTTTKPTPPSWVSQVLEMWNPLIGRAFISVLSIWWGKGLHGLFAASLWADIKGC